MKSADPVQRHRLTNNIGGATLTKLVRQNKGSRRRGDAEGTRMKAPQAPMGWGLGRGVPQPTWVSGGASSAPAAGTGAEPQPLAFFVHFTCYFVRSEAYKFITSTSPTSEPHTSLTMSPPTVDVD